MDSALAHLLLEELRTLRAEAAARDAMAVARYAVLRAQLAILLEGKAETPLSPSFASVGEEALAALAASGRISTAIEPSEAGSCTPKDMTSGDADGAGVGDGVLLREEPGEGVGDGVGVGL